MLRKFIIYSLVIVCGLFGANLGFAASGSLFDGTQPKNGIFTGTPFVLIDKNEPSQTEEVNSPAPFEHKSSYQIQTPFKQKIEEVATPHITDLMTQVQVLGDGTISVWQQIQFISKRPDFIFAFTAPDYVNLESVQMTQNGKKIPFNTRQEGNKFLVSATKPTSTSLNKYEVKYLINTNNKNNNLKFNITYKNWDLPINRMRLAVIFPTKNKEADVSLLYGSNQVQIPEASNKYFDTNGNIVLSATRPIPAKSEITLSLDLGNHLFNHQPVFNNIFWIVLGILFGYGALNLAWLKWYHYKNPLLQIKNYNELVVRHASGTITKDFLSTLIAYKKYVKKPILKETLFNVCHKHYVWDTILFLLLMKKYLITVILILTGGILSAQYMSVFPSLLAILIWILGGILVLFGIYKYGEMRYLSKLIRESRQYLLERDLAFRMTPQAMRALFLRFYPLALAINIDKKWTSYFQEKGLDISSSFDKTSEISK